MQILINSGNTIPMNARLSGVLESDLHRILSRFEAQLTRIEVHVSDENGVKKADPLDKRCTLEARPRHFQSLTVTNNAADIQTAVSGAAGKMHRLLETTFGRIQAKRKGESPRLA
jgi:ribosome-associated translation inhibitor RaiA